MVRCPEPDAFSGFANGELEADAREALELHVDTCESCRIALSEIGRATPPSALGSNDARAGSEVPSLPAIGELVGRYQIVGELGAGAMGVVYVACDRDLDRMLAIKLIHPHLGAPESEVLRQRMLREGRALARIDHPNVVRVFDVGAWCGALFVAMERAPGTSLRAWLAADRRSPRAIVDVFVQCAAGLAAAHAAGIVHRDVKPDNVVVDDSGRARVTDFGLAQTVERAAANPPDDTVPARAESAPASTPAELQLTRTHGAVGTPAYMAPEQHRGEPVDARADQFALCVMLVEALGGERPFAGASADEYLATMASGRPRLSPSMPARVRRVVGRGLAFAPDQRFPSMAALGRALEPRRPRRWYLMAAAAAALGLGALVASSLATRRADPCADVTARMRSTWDGARDARLAAAFARTGRPFASLASAYVRAGLTTYATGWNAMRLDVCRAGLERGELDASTRARTVRCLEQRVAEVDALVSRWQAGGVEALALAPDAIDRLPPVASCATPEVDPLSPPSADAPRLFAFDGRFAAARAAMAIGRAQEALPLLTALRAELSATAFHALRAEISVALARCERDLGRPGDARRHLIDAIAAADTARADHAKAAAWIGLAALVDENAVPAAEADDALRLSGALLARLGQADELARDHEATNGLLALHRGDHPAALAALRRAISSPATLRPTELARRRQMLARALIAHGDIEPALAELDQAASSLTGAFGPDAPQLVFVFNSMIEPLQYLGRFDDAIARGERALTLSDASFGKDNSRHRSILTNLASAHAEKGDLERARLLNEEVLQATIRELGQDAEAVAVPHLNLGATLLDAGRPTDALPHFERALAIMIKSVGPDHPKVANVESQLATAYATLHHPAQALAHARRALEIREATGAAAPYVAYSRFKLAIALDDAGQRVEGIAMAKRALETRLERSGREARLVAEITKWLAHHR